MGHTMITRAVGYRLSFLCVLILLAGCGRADDLHLGVDEIETTQGSHWYPDEKRTPGHLCSRSDADFDEVRYAEKIPHCARNVNHATRVAVSAPYGVNEDELKDYQVDHLIPLALGGSNSTQNLWPVPYESARNKAQFEFATYNELKEGKITQRQAIAKIRTWVKNHLN